MNNEFWRVASYGYPNPFGDKNAKLSWKILESFIQYGSYAEVKQHWQSPLADRKLDHAAVESRKASFEEFGILYVLSGSDKIVVTPGGQQLIDAANSEDRKTFAWVAVNLLLRFPLCGPPRNFNSARRAPNFPIYWFLWAALFDLDDYIVWPELERVLCKVTDTASASKAIDNIQDLRSGRSSLAEFPLPVPSAKGAFYNSLNQVIVHVGLYYQLLTNEKIDNPYAPDSSTVRRHTVQREYQDLIRLAMGSGISVTDVECSNPGQFVARMPFPPIFSRGQEAEYFEYMGAVVDSIESTTRAASTKVPTLPLGTESVPILTEGRHYRVVERGIIEGDVSMLCRLTRHQRVILSHDLSVTYRLLDKRRTSQGKILIDISTSKFIANIEPIAAYLIGDH